MTEQVKKVNEYNLKDILRQYNDLRKEKEEKDVVISRVQCELDKMEVQGYTERDSVNGGNGGKQHFIVEGFPYPAYSQKRTQLLIRLRQKMEIKDKIEKQINLVEQSIKQINDSRIRRLITLRYIDDLSWIQVAHRMGKHHTAESCRKAVERYLEKN